MQASRTAAGQRWLTNFTEQERGVAALLIDSLHFVDDATVRAGLTGALHAAAYEKPAALVPIRDLDDFGLGPSLSSLLPTAFEDFDPVQGLLGAPGSEALAANLLRNVAFKDPSFLGPASSLADLRDRRCRSIVFVEDYSGSGGQCLKYVGSWLRNKTIKSWKSYGFIRVHVLLYAASAEAFERIRADPRIASVTVVEQAPSLGYAGWSPDQEQAVRALCVKYAQSKLFALGFGGSGGLMVLQHTIPNNLPHILWQTGRRKRSAGAWEPFLPDRKFPPDLIAFAAEPHRPEADYLSAAERLGGSALAAAVARTTESDLQSLILTLGACAGGTRHTTRLVAETGMPKAKVEHALATLHRLGMTDEQNRVTDEGWQELRRRQWRQRGSRFMLQGRAEPYYPRSLRRVEDV
ncbi:hypothetical protein [Micromonospora aurantiaca]|uniref:phosphoribosyltransferase-like protein n=1 Tax=Micromonospora aurantiaca (nom. illeg.) TaxID=47850 RepID=UPI0011A9232A|nr:hypothetical protein [Micromonospora aurantiaca]UFN92695.1 hypothetical protein LF814_22190 [Micromonospora aurantiaca]